MCQPTFNKAINFAPVIAALYDMKIEDKFELLALHRCLMEAKFNPNPNDFDIAGSPIAAKLANECTNELATLEGGWEEWRQAENHPQLLDNLVISLSMQNLNHVTKDSQSKYITDALAPLKASQDTISSLVSKVFGG